MIKEYKTDQIRNVVIVGHLGTGKSTLFDALLTAGGKIERIGNPDTGLVSDFDDEEKSKKMSIRSALGFIEYENVKINIIDTPGTSEFVGESRAALQIAETAILVVDAVDGVQIEAEKAWRYIAEHNIPCIIFINKMDKERASFETIMNNLKTGLKANPAPISIPAGEGADLNGVVDLIKMKLYSPASEGKSVKTSAIPDSMADAVQDYKNALEEVAAEGDDNLIEKYLDTGSLDEKEICTGLAELLLTAGVNPVLCGASENGTGVLNLIETIKDFAPAPVSGKEFKGYEAGKDTEVTVTADPDGPLAAIVWKTYIDQYAGKFNFLKVLSGSMLPDSEAFNGNKNMKERINKLYTMIGSKQEDLPKIVCGDIGVVVKLDKTSTTDTLSDVKKQVVVPIMNLPQPVFSYAIEPVNKSDIDKIGQFFSRVTEENPTVKYEFNAETHETVLSGMGEQQLGIILSTLKNKNKLDVITRDPRVAYRETITKKGDAHYRHKKQSGGHGQFGEVFIRLGPKSRGEGYVFKESIFGGAIPKQYIPGVEKGLLEGLQEGVLGKFPVVDLEVELYDGKFHDVDSS